MRLETGLESVTLNLSASCRCVGMADETDSKSVVSNGVWVQVPPPAPHIDRT